MQFEYYCRNLLHFWPESLHWCSADGFDDGEATSGPPKRARASFVGKIKAVEYVREARGKEFQDRCPCER
jgi:hypothetical protein